MSESFFTPEEIALILETAQNAVQNSPLGITQLIESIQVTGYLANEGVLQIGELARQKFTDDAQRYQAGDWREANYGRVVANLNKISPPRTDIVHNFTVDHKKQS